MNKNVMGSIKVNSGGRKDVPIMWVRESYGALKFSCDSLGSAEAEFGWERLPSSERLEALRWYWEEYLEAPFGPYSARAHAVFEDLPRLRQQLCDALFNSPDSRDLLQRIAANMVRLLIESENPKLQSLPWELLWHGGLPEAKEPRFSVARCFEHTQPESSHGTCRMLFVIARAATGYDIHYHSTIHPLIGSLASQHVSAQLEVLRPATFVRLQEVMAAARESGRPFHILHFDGHGDIDPRKGGRLHFEGSDGAMVSFEEFAKVVAHTPIVVLNACRSGVLPDHGVALANVLLRSGVSAAVAMQGKVRSDAARYFTEAFYEGILNGNTIAEAVDAGRHNLLINNQRVTTTGTFPLEDWAIPVLFGNGNVQLQIDRECEQQDDSSKWKWDDGFVGRDGELHLIERAYRNREVVVLYGPEGVGKSALLSQFLAWICLTTQGAERPAIVELSDLQWHDQDKLQEQLLQSVKSCSDGDKAQGPILYIIDDDKGLGESQFFALGILCTIAAAVAMPVIITSRSAPRELPGLLTSIAVTPLLKQDGAIYAAQLAETYPQATANKLPQWARAALLSAVAQHPQSIRMLFSEMQPFPDTTEQLTGMSVSDWARETCIAVLGHSSEAKPLVAKLDDTDRSYAMYLGHFAHIIDGRILRRYDELTAFHPKADWPHRLNRWCELGLLAEIDSALYWVSPIFYFWILAQWKLGSNQAKRKKRKIFRRVCAELISLSREAIDNQDAETIDAALKLLQFNEQTFTQVTLEAVTAGEYEIAGQLVRGQVKWATYSSSSFQFLFAYEAQAAGVRESVSKISAAAADYMIFVSTEVAKQVADAGDLEGAERHYKMLLDWAERLGHQSSELSSLVHHELGLIARRRKDFSEAEKHLLTALEYSKGLTKKAKKGIPTRLELASLYIDRGGLVSGRQQLELARKEVSPEDSIAQAHIHTRLGRLSILEKNWDAAEKAWYEAMQLFPPGSRDRANAEYQLAFVTFQQKRPKPARALLKNLLGNPYLNPGDIYVDLAMIELVLENLPDAIRSAREAHRYFQRTGDYYGIVRTLFVIGMLETQSGNDDQAQQTLAMAQENLARMEPSLQSQLLADVASLGEL